MSTVTETWWIVTTRAGLALTLPAPLSDTGVPIQPLRELGWVHSRSEITGRQYSLDMSEALFVTTDIRKEDPERLQRSLAKALGLMSSDGFSSDGPPAGSPWDDPENPGGPSTGGRIKKPTRH